MFKEGLFIKIQENYCMNIGKNKTIVLFFDGKNVTSNKNINLQSLEEGSFSKSLLLTGHYFSKKFECKVLIGTDELIMIINKPEQLLNLYKTHRAFDLVSLISQEVFKYFNSISNLKNDIFFHGKIYCIPKDREKSYIKYESNHFKNVKTMYFLKNNEIYRNNDHIKLNEKIKQLQEIEDYNNLSILLKEGILIINGSYYNIFDYINDKKNIYSIYEILNKQNNSIKKIDGLNF